jgi:hypothetical protein
MALELAQRGSPLGNAMNALRRGHVPLDDRPDVDLSP